MGTEDQKPTDEAITFESKEALGAFFDEKYKARDGEWKSKLSAAEEKAAQVDSLQEQIAELQNKAGKKPKVDESMQRDLEALQTQVTTLTERLTEEESSHKATREKVATEKSKRILRDLAAKAGIAKKALPKIDTLFPDDGYRVETSEAGEVSVVFVDDIGRPIDGEKVMKAWAEHEDQDWLRESGGAIGGGIPGSIPGQQFQKQQDGDPLAGLTPGQQLVLARQQRQAKKQAGG
jgi:hypothetical protein